MNKDDVAGLVERLRERAQKIRGYIASSQMVVDYLAPEMKKFENREAPWDTYTVRMSVDHQSSIRRQSKEACEYEEAADALTTLSARVETLEAALREVFLHGHSEGWRGNQTRRDVQHVDAEKSWSLYVSNGALSKTIARQALAGDTNHG